MLNAFRGVQDGVRRTQQVVESSGKSIEDVFDKIKSLANTAFVGFTAKEFITTLANVRGEFQQLEVAFNTMLGSKEKANALMGQLVELAATTPFDLKGVASGAKQLLAYGLEADKVTDTMRRLGDIAAGLGLQIGDLAWLYGTTLTQGRMYAEDLNQFTGRGIPMIAELAKQFGVAESEVKQLVTDGKVGFPQVEQAIKNLTDEGGKFGGLMEAQSHTIIGQISNIKDSIDMAFNELGQQSEGIINTVLAGVSSAVENWKQIGKVILETIAIYGAYKAAVMTIIAVHAVQATGISALTTAEKIHYGWLVMCEKAQKLLNATMLANPYVLLVTAVGALGVSMYNLYTSLDDTDKKARELQAEIDSLKESTKKNNKTIQEYLPIAKNAKESTEKRKEAIDKLKQAYPEYFKSLTIETARNYDVADAVAASNEEYRKRLILMAKLARQRYEEAKANYEKNRPKNGQAPAMMGGTTGYSQSSMSAQELANVKQLEKAWKVAEDAVKDYDKTINTSSNKKTGSSTEAKNTNTDTDKDAKKRARELERIASERKNAQEQLNKELSALEQKNIDEGIDLQKEGTKKRIAEIDNDYKKRIAEINKQEAEFKEKNKEAGTKGLGTNGLTEAQSKALEEARVNAEKKRATDTQKLLTDENKARVAALQDYLKSYGDYEQKRLAITQEYQQKIADAETSGERLNLQAQLEDTLSELDFDQFKDKMDWEAIFGDLGDLTVEQLKAIREQLRGMLTDGDMGIEDYKTAVEQIDKVNEAIVSKQDEVKSALGLILPMQQQRKELELEVEEAQRRETELLKEQADIQDRLDGQRGNLADTLKNVGINISASDVTTANMDAVMEQIGGLFGKDSDIYKNVQKQFDELGKSERELNTTTKKLDKAQSDVTVTTSRLNTFLNNLGNKLQAIAEVMSLVSSNMQSLPDLFSQLGVDMGSELGQGITDLANASQYASSAIQDAMGGNFVGALSNGIGAVKGVLSGFNNILGLGIGKGNAEETAEKIERLTESNDYLRTSIDRLTEKMDDAAGGRAIGYYEEAKDAQERYNENLRQILDADMRYSAAHHSNAYYWGLDPDSLKQVNELLGTSLGNTWNDFSNLTAEQMDDIRTHLPDVWEEMINEGKYGDRFREDWENYADQAGKVEELTEQIRDNLTQTSFDSLRSSFLDTLMDMDADASDFTDDFSEMMQRALLNFAMGDLLDDKLKEWYGNLADDIGASGGDLGNIDIEKYREEWQDMADEWLGVRDAISDITGYDGSGSNGQQSASSKGYETMSQDMSEALYGRFTAMYEADLKIIAIFTDAVITISTLSSVATDCNTELRNILNQQVITNSHLENIAKYTKNILDFGNKLDMIVTNTKNI